MHAAESLFRTTFGAAPNSMAFAPGRVNVIGEHTDYQFGFSLPGAITLGTTVALGETSNGPKMMTDGQAAPGWERYVRAALLEAGCDPDRIAVAVSSNLPIGAGLSSSAALIVATLLAAGSGGDLVELARRAQRAENQAVGLPCGLLDPLAVLFGQTDHVVLIDFQRLQEVKPVRWPESAHLALYDTGVRHNLATSAYEERVQALARMADFYGASDLRTAREFSPENHPQEDAQKARHYFSECARVLEFVEALEAEDLIAMGELLTESHRSLQHDYLVSCPEADAIVDSLLAEPECLGARMVGGGFGGMCLGLFSSPPNRAGLQLKFGPAARVINTSAGLPAPAAP